MADWSKFEDAGGVDTLDDPWSMFDSVSMDPEGDAKKKAAEEEAAAARFDGPDGLAKANAAYAKMAAQANAVPDAKPWDVPDDASEWEIHKSARLRELSTGEPRSSVLPFLQSLYDAETDPERKKERFNALEIERRRDAAKREQIAKDRADMESRGIGPEQKYQEEREAASQDPLGRIIDAPFMRGALTGTANFASKVAETGLRALPGEGAPSQFADKLARHRQDEAAYQSQLDTTQGKIASIPNQVAQMTAEFLPGAAVGVPAWAQATAGGTVDAYANSDNDAYALLSGALQGAYTYAGGKLGGGTMQEMLGGSVAGKNALGLIRSFGSELGEEFGQLVGQAALDRHYGVGPGEITGEDVLDTIAVVGLGTLAGGAMSARIKPDGTAPQMVADAAIAGSKKAAAKAAKKSEKARAFVESLRPSRTQAEEAGVDKAAPTAPARAELAAKTRNWLSAQEFKQQLHAAATSPEEADALIDIYSARAHAAGESLDDYVGKRLKGIEKTTRAETARASGRVLPQARRGEIEVLDEGRAIIRGFESQNVGTLIHETAHLFRRDLTGNQLAAAERHFGVKDGKWDVAAEEKWANGFVRYMRTGRAPTSALKQAFSKYKEWLTGIYKSVIGSKLDVSFNREIRQVYDSLFLADQDAANQASQGTDPAGVKFMVTEADKAALRAKGYSDDDISKMRPADAQAAIEAESVTPVADQLAPESAGLRSEEPSPADPNAAPTILAENRGLPATSVKNAKVDEERAARGLPPLMSAARQPNPDAWDAAMAKIDTDEHWQGRLIEELQAKPRATTPEENAALLHRRITLRNDYYDALEAWQAANTQGDADATAEASARVKAANAALFDFEEVTRAAGTESGRSLQARKMMAEEDYSLAKMEMESSEAKGRDLTDEERQKVIDQHEKIVDAQQKFDAKEVAAEAEKEAQAVTEAMKDARKPAPRTPGTKPNAAPEAEIDAAIAAIKAKVDKKETAELTPFVQRLAKLFWKQGIREQGPMIDALHGVLEPMIPGWTRDQTQRAFSGYGDFRTLSKDDVSVGLRDLKGQTQQLLKIEALEARKPLEKTGVERRVPTYEERRLQKIVNDLKRKYGVVVTDPETQLKSALEARKTYYRNRLVDIQGEIDARQRVIKDKSASPTDLELEGLMAEYKALQAEHEAIFGRREMTDEQRLRLAIAGAERAEVAWQQKLENAKSGIFDAAANKKRRATSPELDAIRARSEALKEEVQLLRDLDSNIQENRKLSSLTASLKDLEEKISDADVKLPEKVSGPDSKAVAELKAKIATARDSLKALRESSGVYDARRLARAKESAQAAIDSLDARIKAGDTSTKQAAPSKTPLDDELRKLKFQREFLNKVMAEMRNAAAPKKSAEQIALQTLKSRMRSETAKLQERLAKGDFTKATPLKPALDAEAAKLKAELDMARDEYRNALEKDRWEKSSVWEKGRRHAADAYDLGRLAMTTGELSFLLRQGKLALASHPVTTVKAMAAALRSMRSEKTARTIENQLFSHPKFEEARQARLHMSDESSSLNKQEEFLMSRWAGNLSRGVKGGVAGAASGAVGGAVIGGIPGAAVGSTVGAAVGGLAGIDSFQRAGRVFMNKLRFDLYLAMEKAATRTGTATEEERQQIARFINESTGRGGLGKAGEPAAVLLGRTFFSPRYLASRIQMLTGHSMWGGTARSRKLIAQEYARIAIGMGLYYSILAASFADDDDFAIETDPRSSDFLKIRVGDTRLDPMAGLSQIATFLSRTATGETKTISGKVLPLRGDKMKFGQRDWVRVAADFGRSKLHPFPASTVNLLAKKDLSGQDVDVKSELGRGAMPITYGDIYTALREHGLPEGVALSVLAFFGEGIQHYDK